VEAIPPTIVGPVTKTKVEQKNSSFVLVSIKGICSEMGRLCKIAGSYQECLNNEDSRKNLNYILNQLQENNRSLKEAVGYYLEKGV